MKVSANQIGINDNRNQKIASYLSSLLIDTINMIPTATNIGEYTAAQALYNYSSNLQQGIINVIEHEYASSFPLTVSAVLYTASEIGDGIEVTLPNNISFTEDKDAQIPYVYLSYNGKALTSISGLNTFTISGFNSINNEVANELDSLLNSTINVGLYDSMESYTAENALNSYSSNLQQAILSAIQNNLNGFYLPGTEQAIYTPSDITDNITINLPGKITSLNNINSQIPGVTLSYNGVVLSAKDGSTTFTIDGFYSTNNEVANQLDSILSDTINISAYENMNSYTAAIALSNESSNLTSAIIEAVKNEIATHISSFDFKGISFTADEIANSLSVCLPQEVS
ncbi:hypothetical protein IKS57_03555 [bacterium]|nr:hypothetical protein [bacterium]